MKAKRWTIEIFIDEHDKQTRARATLHNPDATAVVGAGLARRRPDDTDVPEIGDELAVARALSDMAHQLIDLTVADIEAVTHRSAALYE